MQNKETLMDKMLTSPQAMRDGLAVRDAFNQAFPIAVSRMLDNMIKRLFEITGDAEWTLYGYDWVPYNFDNANLDVFGTHFKLVFTKKAWGEKYGITIETDNSGRLKNFIYGIFKNYNHVPLVNDPELNTILDECMQEPAKHSTHWGWYKIAPAPFNDWLAPQAIADIVQYDFDNPDSIGGFYFQNILRLMQKAAPALAAYAPRAPVAQAPVAQAPAAQAPAK